MNKVILIAVIFGFIQNDTQLFSQSHSSSCNLLKITHKIFLAQATITEADSIFQNKLSFGYIVDSFHNGKKISSISYGLSKEMTSETHYSYNEKGLLIKEEKIAMLSFFINMTH